MSMKSSFILACLFHLLTFFGDFSIPSIRLFRLFFAGKAPKNVERYKSEANFLRSNDLPQNIAAGWPIAGISSVAEQSGHGTISLP